VDFGLFGIANVPGRADNGFDLGESWTFDLNAPILFNSIRFESSVPPPAPGMQVRSDAWRGLSLIGDPGNAAFDSTAGSFTFFATATSGVTMNFPTMSDNGPLTVAPGTDITFSYLGTSPTAIRVMDFAVVPEPSTCYVLLLGFVALIWRNARRMKLGYQDQPEQS
jgi:hypothetical protein